MSEPAGNPRVSLTAYATATIWAHYGFPNAELFTSRRGSALFHMLQGSSRAMQTLSPAARWFTRYLYWRHHWFDIWLQQTAPELAIEIAAGLSARGLNYAASNPGCRYVDYDLPNMIKAKNKRLTRVQLPDNYKPSAADLLAPGLGDELAAPATGPVSVITEGLIDYLDTGNKETAWTHIAELLSRLGGGRYLFEIYSRERLASLGPSVPVFLSAIRHLTGDNMAKHLFPDSNAALELLQQCGFSQVEVIDPAGLADPQDDVPPEYRPFDLIEAKV